MERIGDMPLLLLFVFRFVRLLLSGHQAVAIENAALRMQIAAFQRKRKRPLLTTLDRIFWVARTRRIGDCRAVVETTSVKQRRGLATRLKLLSRSICASK
jgi:hypothetical protein